MAMLAGPRRKQKVINLRAKNNDWSKDTNKFGQKMLEKMGWSSGKGLGANENGITEHIIARYKNDSGGLGFDDKNDQWTKHEDDFNSLLKNLSNDDTKDEIKLHSGVSLEKKSKKSRARVHYHKFTRGKDMSRYSAKDLANIFGKKSLTEVAKEEALKEDNVKISQQVFTEGGSMADYFKQKNRKTSTSNTISEDTCNDDLMDDYEFKGFSGPVNNCDYNDDEETNAYGFRFQGFSTNTGTFRDDSKVLQEVETQLKSGTKENQEAETNESQKKKKVKRKKEKQRSEEEEQTIEDITPTSLSADSNEPIKTKKKRRHDKNHLTPSPSPTDSANKNINEHNDLPVKKKKKKS